MMLNTLPIEKQPEIQRILNLSSHIRSPRTGLLKRRINSQRDRLAGICRGVKGVDVPSEGEVGELRDVFCVDGHF